MAGVKVVFLDRDGVINHPVIQKGKPYAPRSLKDFVLYEDGPKQLQILKNAGFILVVVTNQPDVGHGVVSRAVVEEMNKLIENNLPIDLIKTCFHRQDENCICRKPKSAMLRQAIVQLDRAPIQFSCIVGDRWSDIECGKEFGCKTFFIDRNYKADPKPVAPDFVVYSLEEAVKKILVLNE